MTVDIRAKWYEVRFYRDGNGYEDAGPFYASMNVTISGQEAEVSMAQAFHDLTRADLRDFCRALHLAGVKTLFIDRALGHRVPFGTISWQDSRIARWSVAIDRLPFISGS